MLRNVIAVLVVGLVAVSASAGFDFTAFDVEYWVGDTQAANSAMCVIDLTSDGGDAYVFGYRWDGAATGYDMLTAIDAGGDLIATIGFDVTYGHSLNGFEYDNVTSDPNVYRSYWVCDDGMSWLWSGTGIDGRTLSDGDWDAWSIYGGPPSYMALPPVPEPATMALLALGGVALIRRRK